MEFKCVQKGLLQSLKKPWTLVLLLVSVFLWQYWVIKLMSIFLAFNIFHDISVQQEELKQPDKHKVVIIGAGISGLCMAVKLKEIGIKDIVILEQNKQLGGTWFSNIYPGVSCDISCHLYSISYFTNPKWSKTFSGGSEIWAYLLRFAETFDILRHIKLNTKVQKAVWSADKSVWTISTEAGYVFQADFCISAVGVLHVPYTPNFKGLEKFSGPTTHTADWKEEFEFKNRKIGVIGTGASAVQVVPAIVQDVKELHVFQRTPPYVTRRKILEHGRLTHWILCTFPWIHWLYRNYYFWYNELTFHLGLARPDSIITKITKSLLVTGPMKKALAYDKELVKKLIPSYQLGCKRVTPSETYLQAFLKPQTTLHTDGIDSFNSKGILTTNGDHTDLDGVIFATGFDAMRGCKSFQVIGKDNQDLGHIWGDLPKSYLCTTYPGFPNYFTLLGPNAGLGHNSIVFMIECQANYVVSCIRTLEKMDKTRIECKEDIFEKYCNWLEKEMGGTAFARECNTWYKNKDGINFTLWPQDLVHFWWKTLWCNKNDYRFY